jgi:hypothetical protein
MVTAFCPLPGTGVCEFHRRIEAFQQSCGAKKDRQVRRPFGDF